MPRIVHWQRSRSERTLAMFVGEAPADVETWKGIPFVGPSGKLLRALCHQVGLDPYQCAFTNVLDFQLKSNSFHSVGVSRQELPKELPERWRPHILTPVETGFYMMPEMAAHHLARLVEEINEAEPAVVVPLGKTAIWAVLGTSGAVKKLRGSIQPEILSGQNRKCIPTYHPAHIKRQYHQRAVLLMDLIKIKYETGFDDIRLPARHLLIEPTLEEVRWWFRTMNPNEILSTDIEKKRGQIDCISFSQSNTDAICVPFERHDGTSYWPTLEAELEVMLLVRDALLGPIPKLFHNGMYDVWNIWEIWGIGVRNYRHDTRLVHHVLFPELDKDLATLVGMYENETSWKLMNRYRTEKRDG